MFYVVLLFEYFDQISRDQICAQILFTKHWPILGFGEECNSGQPILCYPSFKNSSSLPTASGQSPNFLTWLKRDYVYFFGFTSSLLNIMPNIKGAGKCHPATCLQVILDLLENSTSSWSFLYAKYIQPLPKVDKLKVPPSCHSFKLNIQGC